MEERMLLATFARDNALTLSNTLSKIAQEFPEVKRDLVFIFENKKERRLILTYDVPKQTEKRFKDIIGSTLQLHRKKKYNVFFTLNALNRVIDQDQVMTREELDWSKYKNSLLLTNNGELRIVPISFRGIENLNIYRENTEEPEILT